MYPPVSIRSQWCGIWGIAANGCDSIVHTELTVLPLSYESISPVICYGQNFSVGSSTYSIAGLYTDTLTAANGCDSIITTDLTVIPVSAITLDIDICDGNDFKVGDSSYSVSGNYIDTLTASKGCDSIVELSLTVLPVSVTNYNTSICMGEAVAVGTSSYDTSGIYYDTLVAANGCDSIIITDLLVKPIFNTIIDTAICRGDSFVVGSSYYSTNGTFYDTLPATNGCDSFITTHLTMLPVINGTADTFTCHGESIPLHASGGASYEWMPFSSLSCSNCSDPVASPDSSTTYIVKVTSVEGCIGYDTILVAVDHIQADFEMSDSVICAPAEIQFSDHSNTLFYMGLSWDWDFGNGSHAISPNPEHAYAAADSYVVKLRVSTILNCSDSLSKTLILKESPQANAGPDTTMCRGDSIRINATGGDLFSWSPSNNINDTTIANPIAYPDSTGNYLLKVANLNGCIDFDTLHITVNPLPQTFTSTDTVICLGESIGIEAGGGVSYSWYPAAGLDNAIISNPTATPDSTTLYSVEVTNQYGCQAFDTVLVGVKPEQIVAASGNVEICQGDSVPITASGAMIYNWYPSAGLSCDSCQHSIVSPSSNTTYILSAIDQYGCSHQDSVKVTVHDNPFIYGDHAITICKGEEMSLPMHVYGADSLSWYPPKWLDDPRAFEPVSAPLDSIQYTVTAFNAFGCHYSDTIAVNVIEQVRSKIIADSTVCKGQMIHLVANIGQFSDNGYELLWYPPQLFDDPTLAEQAIKPATDTKITLIVSSQSCAADTQIVNINVYDLPEVDAGGDQVAYPGEDITLEAQYNDPVININWEPSEVVRCWSCATAYHTVDQSRTFRVSVMDENGCTGIDSMSVRVVSDCSDEIFLPNSFTPNGDDINDKFIIRTRSPVLLKQFRIFDRWGNQVYESTDIHEGWDGSYKRGVVYPGVYVYYMKADCRNGKIVTKKGNVTVIR